MKFLIYSSDQVTQSKLESTKKILMFLYGSTEIEIRTTKIYPSTIKKAVDEGTLVFDVTSKKSKSDGVHNLDLKESTSALLYGIVEYVNLGISESVILKAISFTNRELKR